MLQMDPKRTWEVQLGKSPESPLSSHPTIGRRGAPPDLRPSPRLKRYQTNPCLRAWVLEGKNVVGSEPIWRALNETRLCPFRLLFGKFQSPFVEIGLRRCKRCLRKITLPRSALCGVALAGIGNGQLAVTHRRACLAAKRGPQIGNRLIDVLQGSECQQRLRQLNADQRLIRRKRHRSAQGRDGSRDVAALQQEAAL